LPELYSKEIHAMQAGDIRGPLRAGNGFHIIKLVEIKGGTGKHIVTKTKVRHILVKQDSGTTAAEAKKKVYNLHQQLKSGKSFAVFAKKYSADLGNAGKGGDLGWVTDGQLVPEFEKAMNALKVKEISQPVKSVFGWHIIQVLERKKVDDTVAWKKKQVREFLFQRKMAEAVQTWQQHLRAEAYVKVLDKELS